MPLNIPTPLSTVNVFLSAIHHQLAEQVAHAITEQLEADVEAWLHRGYHERRRRVQRQSGARCQRCGTQKASAFSRNGHRKRQLVRCYGVLTFLLPRVVCQCGGSVIIPFSILRPYQQLWDDLLHQIARWANLGLSLRQMQGEVGHHVGTQVGLRKPNETVHSPNVRPFLHLSSPVSPRSLCWMSSG